MTTESHSGKRNPFAIDGKTRRKFLAAITSRRDYLAKEIATGADAGQRHGWSREEEAALDWALQLLELAVWRSVKTTPPPAGEPLIVRSKAAGVSYAIRSGERFVCACGCGESLPDDVTSWMTAPTWSTTPAP